jgi:hypothetical protein
LEEHVSIQMGWDAEALKYAIIFTMQTQGNFKLLMNTDQLKEFVDHLKQLQNRADPE